MAYQCVPHVAIAGARTLSWSVEQPNFMRPTAYNNSVFDISVCLPTLVVEIFNCRVVGSNSDVCTVVSPFRYFDPCQLFVEKPTACFSFGSVNTVMVPSKTFQANRLPSNKFACATFMFMGGRSILSFSFRFRLLQFVSANFVKRFAMFAGDAVATLSHCAEGWKIVQHMVPYEISCKVEWLDVEVSFLFN